MRSAGFPDCLSVINGPEDGVEFPINRSPFNIGRNGQCAVCLQLDDAVESVHARVTASGNGYNVRGLNGGTVYIDGKKAGMLRSRELRPGSVLRVGYTELILECAPDGLASRSKGLASHNDFIWALRASGMAVLVALGRMGHFIRMAWWRALRRWKLIAIIGGGAAYYFIPPFRYFVIRVWRVVSGWAQELFAQLSG